MAADLSLSLTLRGGLILPSGFGTVGGKFLYVGGSATGEYAGVMDTGTFATALFASNTDTAGLWTQPVFAPSFGSFSGDVLVTNQGGSIDSITPSGGIGTLATFASGVAPFGAALAGPSFGEVGGTSLIVSDSGGNGIYTVDTHGTVKLFTTIPFGTGQNSLRQIAFAPKEWKAYGGDLFVSLNTRDIDVVNRDGVVIGKISGAFNPRGLLFTTMSGKPTLLFSNTVDGTILKAGPGDIVPVGH